MKKFFVALLSLLSALCMFTACDKLNIELRQVEQTYHLKMMRAIPAKKVYDAIMAENNFHRRMMRGGFQAPNGFNGFQGWQNPFGQQRGKRR